MTSKIPCGEILEQHQKTQYALLETEKYPMLVSF
jgi:bisphosphoglycerate-independent phosphoglycerate mutase (AlkP superfamily)